MTFDQYWATVTTGTWRDEAGARAAFRAGMLRAAEIARGENRNHANTLTLGAAIVDAIEREASPATPSAPTSEGEETGK